MLPAGLDGSRDQNSIILLSKAKFSDASVAASEEVTAAVMSVYSQPVAAAGDGGGGSPEKKLAVVPVGLSPGDLYVLRIENYLLFSFHGDTNGLASVPAVSAVAEYANSLSAASGGGGGGGGGGSSGGGGLLLIGGIDANTHEGKPPATYQGLAEFAQGLTRCVRHYCTHSPPNRVAAVGPSRACRASSLVCQHWLNVLARLVVRCPAASG
eukprot:SAG22_NODE_2547_length_2458_cov_2.399322_3_plen_211_part_00